MKLRFLWETTQKKHKNLSIFVIIIHLVGTWRSLVAHTLGVRGVGGSNPPVPTIFNLSSLAEC